MKHYVFAYGSLLNQASRDRTTTSGSQTSTLEARIAATAGYYRAFNFRSKTGFTALGLKKADAQFPSLPINGLLVKINSAGRLQRIGPSRKLVMRRLM